MHTIIAPLVAATLLLAACADAREPVTAETREAAERKAAAAAKRLGGSLLTELTTALGASPPEAAVHLCAEIAGRVADEISTEQGVRVGRTALRVRNRANAPDEWERTVLVDWTSALDEAAPRSEVVDTPDGPALRWMAPIRLVGMCTRCHGNDTEISTATRAAIQDRYPDDQATDFAVGDLRGAFTVTVPID